MSIYPLFTLFCDGCRRVAPTPGNGWEDRQSARRAARRAGWKRIPNRDHRGANTGKGKDLCGSCAPDCPEAK